MKNISNFITISVEEKSRRLAMFNKLEEQQGWTRVDYPHFYENSNHIQEITAWCNRCCGEFARFGRSFSFKNGADAALFIMRWS